MSRLDKYMPESGTWRAKYVNVSEIVKDFENGTLDRSKVSFLIDETEVTLVNNETNEALFNAHAWEVVQLFARLNNVPAALTPELKDKYRLGRR